VLGLEEWKGSKDNNIILQTGYLDANCAAIVKAPNEKDPARKYKLYYWVGPQWTGDHLRGMGLKPTDQVVVEALKKMKAYKSAGQYVAFSADGVNFTPKLDKPVVVFNDTPGLGDTSTVLFDEQAGCYRAYLRMIRNSRRCYSLAESDDGVNFKPPVPVLDPTPEDDA